MKYQKYEIKIKQQINKHGIGSIGICIIRTKWKNIRKTQNDWNQ